jgi:D-glycero-D-manno-heptose 1,7-bisphosphate phosphatase
MIGQGVQKRRNMAYKSTSALLLDRDGVINVDRGYVHRIEDFEFIPGIFELTRFVVQQLGWPVIVITNQAGIARGFYDEAAYLRLTQWMCECFSARHAPIARVYHCPYHPEHGVGPYRLAHDWRKPLPGMIMQAQIDFDLDLSKSVLIGDKISDIAAGAAAGVKLRIRIDPLATPPGAGDPPHQVVRNLEDALFLLQSECAVHCSGKDGVA